MILWLLLLLKVVNLILITVIETELKDIVIKNIFYQELILKIKILIDGTNFYDQNISDGFKKYEELRKVMTGRGEEYTTGSLLDYDYWKSNYKLICCNLSKQKVLEVIQKLINRLNLFTN